MGPTMVTLTTRQVRILFQDRVYGLEDWYDEKSSRLNQIRSIHFPELFCMYVCTPISPRTTLASGPPSNSMPNRQKLLLRRVRVVLRSLQ